MIDLIQPPSDTQASRDALLQDSIVDENAIAVPKQPRKLVKPKGQVKDFETKRLPNYLRKQR